MYKYGQVDRLLPVVMVIVTVLVIIADLTQVT